MKKKALIAAMAILGGGASTASASDPLPTGLHRVFAPAKQSNGVSNCMTYDGSGAAGSLVLYRPCSSTDPKQKWTFDAVAGETGGVLRLVSNTRLCVAPQNPNSNFSHLTLQSCSSNTSRWLQIASGFGYLLTIRNQITAHTFASGIDSSAHLNYLAPYGRKPGTLGSGDNVLLVVGDP